MSQVFSQPYKVQQKEWYFIWGQHSEPVTPAFVSAGLQVTLYVELPHSTDMT